MIDARFAGLACLTIARKLPEALAGRALERTKPAFDRGVRN